MAVNRNLLKKYAPQARLDFIQAVTNRAALFGITKSGNVAGEVRGDLFILNGKAFPRSVASQRTRLMARIGRDGFAQVMEAVAYTWFNRFLAIRYMEVHDYFDHGCRVLSHPAGHDQPEILEKAATINLPGVDRDEIINLKLDGTKDEQIYRRLLIAQCNDLHNAMPFLFERIEDETELLLPENLLQTESIVRKLVDGIDEVEWQEIEIIGWLYQFYISDKKDQVIGKVVKSEDIPAATQLFTPNWIVKYMVQNSLGAQWLATYPDSAIRAGMEYYIAPAVQTPEVQAQIDAITPTQLDPEAITLIDPAVGSGHILVEAYDLFRAIYLERGYTMREAARAILTKNLFGLDIDDRAAQMAGFALLMKACADDRSVLRNPPKLNVLALQDSEGLDADALTKALLPQVRFELVPSGDLLPETLAQPTLAAKQSISAEAKSIKALVTPFNGAKTFGSLITVPDVVMQSLPLLDALLAKPLTGDLYHRQAQEEAREALKPLIEQARLLGSRYDCVVANPPYMGTGGMNKALKKFADLQFPRSKSNIFSIFMESMVDRLLAGGRLGMVTLQNWMFTSSFSEMRISLFEKGYFESLVHIGYNSFPEMNSKVVQAAAFVYSIGSIGARGIFYNLNAVVQNADKKLVFEQKLREMSHRIASVYDFKALPGCPLMYDFSQEVLDAFENNRSFADVTSPRAGISTGDNSRFQRQWSEVSIGNIGMNCDSRKVALATGRRWFPCNSGGPFRKWYGNDEIVIDWENDGIRIRSFLNNEGKLRSAPRNLDFMFKSGITWTKITTSKFSARKKNCGFLFDDTGRSAFSGCDEHDIGLLGILSSKVGNYFLSNLNPTMTFTSNDVANVPISDGFFKNNESIVELISLAKSDWDSYEISWDFSSIPLLSGNILDISLPATYDALSGHRQSQTIEMHRLEEENNRLFIDAYGLQGELTPDVPLSEITLTCNPHHRYGGDLTVEEREARLKSDTMRELVSYAVGCMMGRFSLAESGLIYAHAGGVGFDPSRYGAFPADDDGIIPLTEEQWFADDAAARIEEFLAIAWPEAPVVETMTRLMDGLSMDKAGEPRAALRSYLSKQFYKDHLQTYKNRPIYWLFSSGKQKAFEALVYLHRYNEGTLARMRTDYVTPLMGKLHQRIGDLDAEIAASSSTADKTRKGRDKDKIAKQVVELRTFDEELRHLADQRTALDLDDGVKVNYGRFGNLLAFKDKVCPKKKGEDE